jgi:hypothetical protein
VLHLAYPPRTTPADNAPVIFNTPMGRFVAVSNEGGAEYSPGVFSSSRIRIRRGSRLLMSIRNLLKRWRDRWRCALLRA